MTSCNDAREFFFSRLLKLAGAIIGESLSFTSYIDITLSKCSKVCAVIKCSVLRMLLQSERLSLFSDPWISILLNEYVLSHSARCLLLHFLPLSYRREVSDLLFLFNCINGEMNNLFNDEISMSTSNLRSFNAIILTHPLVRTERFVPSFFHTCCSGVEYFTRGRAKLYFF